MYFRQAPRQLPPCALTIGNFDGVHRGHQVILNQVIQAAKSLEIKSAVLTFSPHPREFFSKLHNKPELAPAIISGFRDKMQALAKQGIEEIFVQHFDQAFATMPPDVFVEDFLIKKLNVKWLLVGNDFRFGAKRQGNLALLQDLAPKHHVVIQTLDDVLDEEHQRISSTAVRTALQRGDFAEVKHLLGRAYEINGRIVHGKKLGRNLGYPTMNIRLGTDNPALSGVFVVQVNGLAKHPLPAVASLGKRPTVDQDGQVLLEVHVFNFSEQVYGQHVSIEFLEKIRDEQKFSDLSSLQQAIDADARYAQHYFQRQAVSATDRI